MITRQDLAHPEDGKVYEGEAERSKLKRSEWELFGVDVAGELDFWCEKLNLTLFEGEAQVPQCFDEVPGDDIDACLAYLNEGGVLLFVADEPGTEIGRFVAVRRADDFSWVTDEMFMEKLEEIVDRCSAGELLGIPGVYEVLSEHFNNDVLDELEDERD